ncbi:hypothetical protein AB9M22_001830 [Salmonella enterica]
MSSFRPVFRSRWLPYLLVAPQLVITVIFFIWPAGEALWYSLQSVDPFGFSSQFVGLENFVALFHDSYYLDAFWTTIKFSALVTFSGLLVSLFFAALVDYVVRGSRFYQTLMLLPYAVAPAVAAVLWIFLFNPGRGLITHFLGEFGYDWNRGPVQATTTLIYKIYREGFTGLDLSASAAQSVVLMFLVIILTVVQFRYVESKVRYQ